MSTIRRFIACTLLALITASTSGTMPTIGAQSLPTLFEAAKPGAQPKARDVRAFQARRARLRLQALDAPAFRLNLFDNADRFAHRTRLEQKGPNQFVWEGRTDDGGIATFAIVNGVATGTVFLDGRTFEIFPDTEGDYTIEELDAAAFPTEDAPIEGQELEADRGDETTTEPAEPNPSPAPVAETTGPVEIGVMVLWTPAARSAQGGTSAIQSLILSAVNNANLAYSNSGVNAHLKLVHSAEVAFTETTTNIAGDLSAFRSKTDGKADGIHALRDQYAADIVSVIGQGYAGKGYCGVGYLMASASTAFASNAFNVVDRTCASGYLSFAHEVGHNQGLQHDPGNASSSGSYSYAYGYQDPGHAFRTVLSYGGAPRVPYFSNPDVTYNGRVTGTATQNNAKALSNTAPIVAQFRAGAAPACSYTVSPGSLTFTSGSGTATVDVTTTTGCSWTSSSPAAWATVTGSGTGSGTATVSVTANGTTSRSATLTIAGKSVTVGQAASACSYSVTPTALSFDAASGTATVSVSTTAGCGWSASSPVSWATVTSGGSGSGTATVAVTANGTTARGTTLTVAGTSVSVTQAAPACSYTVTPTSLSFTEAGGTATVSVSAPAGCGWSASSPASWAAVTSGGSGSGTATVSVSVNSTSARSATLTVAGTSVSVSQAALACSYTVTPASLSFTSSGGTATVFVSAPAGCGWTTSGSTSWALVTGSGSGSGAASVQVSGATSGSTRSATVTVAGKAVSISQAGKKRGT